MLNDINPWVRNRLIIIAIILVAFIVWLCSCSVAKKDQAAVSRVNAKYELQIPVVNEYLKAHPRDTSTKIITIPGEIIRVPVPIMIRDTARERKIRDSLLTIKPDCLEAVKNAYDLAYDEAEKYYKEHPITVNCPPSIKETITNNFDTRRWQDSAAKKDREIAKGSGHNEELKDQNTDLKKRNTNLWWLFAASLVFTVLSHVARSYIPKLPFKIPKL